MFGGFAHALAVRLAKAVLPGLRKAMLTQNKTTEGAAIDETLYAAEDKVDRERRSEGACQASKCSCDKGHKHHRSPAESVSQNTEDSHSYKSHGTKDCQGESVQPFLIADDRKLQETN